MTDDRLGGLKADDELWLAIRNLPRGAGIVFRHYGLKRGERRRLLARVARLAARRGLLLVGSGISGAPDGVHLGRSAGGRRSRPAVGKLVTAPAHGRREMLEAFRRGADLVFLSPVFSTRSHPGAEFLGPVRFGLAARGAPGPVLALGGMDRKRGRRMQPLGAAGYGGIDCWVKASRHR
ncbi:thiamine phosphate synthase [Sandaracinobacteroides hominis]|uniref:thiamine phosphate synthase n=1 Tax=Sandaracinobacteroides hominis TaxID=2780086 RepID=UPI0018F46768|nr:thiamine phosphate synthase [Sandaracinobacteroides hominis]